MIHGFHCSGEAPTCAFIRVSRHPHAHAHSTPHTRRPLLWFMPEVDLRHLSGDAIFHRGGGGNVSLPTFDPDTDEGIYEDAIALARVAWGWIGGAA